MRRALGPALGVLLVSLASFGGARGEAQQAPPVAEADAEDAVDLWRRAREAEDQADPAAALAAYRALVAADPSHRLASRARRRIAYLETRSEGGLEPFAQVMAVRADPSAESVAALERDLESFPEGQARREARSLVASSWLRLGQAERAVAAYRALLAEEALPAPEARRARMGLARALQAAGDPAAALQVLEAAGEGEGALSEAIASQERSRWGSLAAVVVIGLFLLWLGWRTGLRPFDGVRARHVGLCAWVLLVPLAIAHLYDPEATDTFLWLAVASTPVLLGAAALGRHARGRRERWVGALGAVAAELSVAYLVIVERGAVLGVGP